MFTEYELKQIPKFGLKRTGKNIVVKKLPSDYELTLMIYKSYE